MSDGHSSEMRANYSLVQALRGIAALWVVLFHASAAQHVPALRETLPSWLGAGLFDAGHYGVAIFFALSGFVIAHSLLGSVMTSSRFGQFMLRRSIRLDPAYWTSMAIVVGVGIAVSTLRAKPYAVPDTWAVLAHIAYLQEILAVKGIDVVYWTLTYEIQFYAVFALAMMVRGFMWPLFMLALLSAAGTLDGAPQGLFVHFWGAFFVGVLARHAIDDRQRMVGLIALAVLLAIDDAFGAISAATALLLYASVRSGFAEQGLGWRWIQFLGTVSYSLYLIHNPVTAVVGWAAHKLLGHGVLADLASLSIILAASIAAAWLLWFVIERPTQQLSKRAFVGNRRISIA